MKCKYCGSDEHSHHCTECWTGIEGDRNTCWTCSPRVDESLEIPNEPTTVPEIPFQCPDDSFNWFVTTEDLVECLDDAVPVTLPTGFINPVVYK